MKLHPNKYWFLILLALSILESGLFFSQIANAGTLLCSVTTAAACTGTVIYRMSGGTNAHAELPSQTTAAYNNNVICCTGVTGLGNSCTGIFATALKLSGTTNAHVQQTGSYANSACISVPSGGSVSVGYQATNCTGFDTTLGSMSGTTNAHVGNSAAYPTIQICGTAGVSALGVTAPANVTLTEGKPGVTTETTFGTGELVVVTDGGAGWSLTLQMTAALTKGSDTIPTSSVYIKKDGIVGGGSDLATIWSGVTTNVSETEGTVSLDVSRGVGTRSSGTGGEVTNVRPTIQIVMPPGQALGDYINGNIRFTVA